MDNSPLSLRLKIIVGYGMLLALLSAIVILVGLEHKKRETLISDEIFICQKREAINKLFEKLLEFSFSDDFVLYQNNNKYDEYRMKRQIATSALNELKQYYQSDIQHTQIDEVSSLLLEKEKLMFGVMNTLSGFSRADSMLRHKIPLIASQVKIPQQTNLTVEAETVGKKRGGFLGFFTNNKQKSAYTNQKDKSRQQSAFKIATGKLYSLQKEMHTQYIAYWEKLAAYSDSLQIRNMELNSRISTLIREFEQIAVMQAKKEMEEIAVLREQSFRIILFIAAAAILLIVVFYFFIHHDIKKRQEYRIKLEASDRRNRELLIARRNLILTVSHDLRAPLGTISEYAEMLQDEKDVEISKGYAVNILCASRHVIGLANNLLYYYRLEAEKEKPGIEIFHLRRTIEDTAQSFMPTVQKKGLNLIIDVKNMDLLVEGDCMRLVQILNNLLSNAVKFTHTGYIYVGAQYRNGKLCISIKDTGIGIDKERQEKIFTAFERGEVSNAEHGFGLGLAITYKLVALLGGTIHVQSTLGHGSNFEVCLPVCEADGKTGTPKTHPLCGDLAGMRVLAIDDDRMQLDVTKKMFARYGAKCDCCLNISELVVILRNNRYDLVLTDIRMPETDGYGVLSLLRGSNLGQTKTIPILAVTAQADEEPENFKNVGFAGCLHKPFSPEELLSAILNIDRPIFTAIMEGEDDPREMLNMFIEDTEEELMGMQDALSSGDYKSLRYIIHKAAPLWGMIRINIPLKELEELSSMPLGKWGKVMDERINRLIKAVEQAVKKAKELIEKV